MSYTVRRRRLSSITRAPCRKVIGMPGVLEYKSPILLELGIHHEAGSRLADEFRQ